jgi:8-oxo-dGTP pyrophosphatase MutT (NUDIX family)
MCDNLIDIIKKEIVRLPGKRAQYLMAPNDRDFKEIKNEIRIAAVMIILHKKTKKYYLTLIKRQEYDGPHSGQISFPGGKYEKKDENLLQTAIRETKEEIGVRINKTDVIGKLTPLLIPVSSIMVHPFIAFVERLDNYVLQKKEVNDVIEISLDDLLNPKNIKKDIKTRENKKIIIPYFYIKNCKIWGATAMILSELIEVIKKSDCY